MLVNKKFTFLNLIKITGLSLALSGILLISLYLKNELSYDAFHNKSGRIYRFTISNKVSGQHFARIYRPDFLPELTEKTAGVENYTRLVPFRGGILKYHDNYININQGFHCDSTFFEVFDTELLVGNPKSAIDEPGSMVISESFAKRNFGNSNPIGQTLTRPTGQFYSQEEHFTVTGVMKDWPQNSHFHPEFIVYPSNENAFRSWAWTYLVLAQATAPSDVKKGINDYYISKMGEEEAEDIGIFLQNIEDIHLHSHKLREIETNSDVSVIYTFFIAAGVLLLIALINFANLNIGMASFSDKYLFVSKTFGASRGMNLKYFFTESLIILLATIVLSSFIIIPVQNLIQQYFHLDLFTGNIEFILFIMLLFSLLVLMSGMLPVFRYLLQYFKSFSGYQNNHAIQNRGMSKPLLVFQYTISIMLIIAVFAIYKQTSYAMQNSMGAQKNNLICMERVHTNVQKKFGLFKSELLKHRSIESVSAMMEDPGGEINDKMRFTMDGFTPDESDEIADWITILPCDYSFAGIFDLNFIAGKNFSKNNDSHKGIGEYIINESALKKFNYTNASDIIGKEFKLHFDRGKIDIPRGQIIGVVEDFHFSSLKRKIQPMVLFKRKAMWLMNFIISYTPGMREEAIDNIEKVWTKIYPGYPLQYQYITSMYNDVYRTELIQARLLSVFTFIALFICSMGLLGMSLLLTQRKEKEIGIRKVNGARTREVIRMLNWQLLKWVLISFLLAVPIAFFAMHQWLENFAYRITLSWWIFALAGSIAIAVAFLTVTLNSWRAATRNPTEVLRDE